MLSKKKLVLSYMVSRFEISLCNIMRIILDSIDLDLMYGNHEGYLGFLIVKCWWCFLGLIMKTFGIATKLILLCLTEDSIDVIWSHGILLNTLNSRNDLMLSLYKWFKLTYTLLVRLDFSYWKPPNWFYNWSFQFKLINLYQMTNLYLPGNRKSCYWPTKMFTCC